jgi:hypothetical protein
MLNSLRKNSEEEKYLSPKRAKVIFQLICLSLIFPYQTDYLT